MKLKELRNIDSDILLYSKEINYGDWPFRFIVKIEYPENWGDNAKKEIGKYHVELLAVSPVAAKDVIPEALQSCGLTGQDIPALGLYEVLVDYGTTAHLWQGAGNNLSKLMQACRKELRQTELLFGLAMDRQQNAIGATGWDWIAGSVFPHTETEVSA